jgi:tetratricopeptide (TPR) repeat protein
MRFRAVVGVLVAAVLFICSSAEAQRHHRTPPTEPQTPPQTTPTTPTTPPPTEPTSRDQEARMLFEAGRVAYAAGRFDDSLGYFQRAYEMSGRPVLLYNVGSAADKLRRDAVALDAFRRYLEAMPSAENREEVQSRITVLEQVVAAEDSRTAAAAAAAAAAANANGADTAGGDTTNAGSETAAEGALDASLQVGGTGNDTPHDGGGPSIFGQWWFWTIVGVVAVGATVGIVAGASSGGGLAPFQTGDDGSVYMTLGMP